MSFKKTAAHWKATLTALAEKPYAFVESQIQQGTNESSFVSNIVGQSGGRLTLETEHITKWTAASLYTGGADTVSVWATEC